MPVTLLSSPGTSCAIPAANCAQYCFQADDYVLGSDSFAAFNLLVINNAPQFGSVINDGDTFTIAGYTFTATAAGPTTSNSFEIGTTTQQTAENFAAMLSMNYYFSQAFDVTAFSFPLFGFWIIEVVARKCGQQENYDFNTIGAGIQEFGAMNGSCETVEPCYFIKIEVFCPPELCPIIEQSYTPDETGKVCYNVAADVKKLLYTQPPNFTKGVIEYDTTAKKDIYLKYTSFKYSNETVPGKNTQNCEMIPSSLATTEEITLINSAIQADDLEGFAPYCIAESLTDTQLITARPLDHLACPDGFEWVRFCADLNKQFGDGPFSFDYFASYEVEFIDGSTDSFDITVPSGADSDGFLVIPSGPCNIYPNGAPGTIKCLSVQFGAILQPVNFPVPIGQPHTVCVGKCCDNVQFYFLETLGNYGTFYAACIYEENVITNGVEICTDVVCGGTTDELTQGGKDLSCLEAYDKTIVQTRIMDSHANRYWLKEFLIAPIRYARLKNKAGEYQLYKILISSNETTYFVRGQQIYLNIEFIKVYQIKLPN